MYVYIQLTHFIVQQKLTRHHKTIIVVGYSHLILSVSFVTSWPVVHHIPLSMGLSRQEFQSWVPFPSPEVLPDPGIKAVSPTLQVDLLPLSHQGN